MKKKMKYDMKCPRCNSPARLLEIKNHDGNSSEFKYQSAYYEAVQVLKRVRDGGLSDNGMRQVAHECLLELSETVIG